MTVLIDFTSPLLRGRKNALCLMKVTMRTDRITNEREMTGIRMRMEDTVPGSGSREPSSESGYSSRPSTPRPAGAELLAPEIEFVLLFSVRKLV